MVRWFGFNRIFRGFKKKHRVGNYLQLKSFDANRLKEISATLRISSPNLARIIDDWRTSGLKNNAEFMGQYVQLSHADSKNRLCREALLIMCNSPDPEVRISAYKFLKYNE